jgi:hypothetical protein
VVCNFPSILATLEGQGCRTAYFFPAYDPELGPFADRQNRPVDVLFVGGYTRHHRQRAAVLEAVAKLGDEYNIVYHLDRSRLCRLAESWLGQLLPLASHRRPSAIRAIAKEPRFGRDYYELLSAAKIVLNGAIDMAGADRGNMRCFEALGAGSLLLSDEGSDPDGMEGRRNHRDLQFAGAGRKTDRDSASRFPEKTADRTRGPRDGVDPLFKRSSMEALRGARCFHLEGR